MATAQVTKTWQDWVGLAARLVLGVALGYAGALKVGDLEANAAQVELYQLPFPGWVDTLVGYAQPFVEIAIGLLLVLGLFTRIAAALGALAMAVFIAGIIWAWSKGLQIDCGCFSVGGVLPEGAETQYVRDIARDIGFMACGLWLWIRPTSVLAVDNWLLAPVTGADYYDDDNTDEAASAETTNPGR